MARRLRIQYENALYHVINRGNYRANVFSSAGTIRAFQSAVGEACERHGWRLHAYVVMRNHFHLALETPQPNLVEGMHWLQSTFATRFNRFRSENGHLFQGRYRALLVEDEPTLCRVIDYIHLNPVRAGIVPALEVAGFAASSLSKFLQKRAEGVTS
jgi:putative transposase